MAIQESITLLHVSDMQFGRNHRFGNLASGDPDASFDTLFKRLADDLDDLRAGDPSLRPQAIVVSGDLAEWGRASEFRDARDMLERLCEHLELPRRNLVMVPGNHDVNRRLVEAYFAECDADEEQPIKPYARKWKHYERMFEEFYAGEQEVGFTVEEPWTLWEIEELNLVVAGLNSTMRESHLPDDHYGWVGERQLRWFEKRLDAYAQRGWFRLGVVHHNAVRGPVADDENLRDADALAARLGPTLNLLLHGHTHDGKLTWLGPGALPVLSTGSAALRGEARPPDVPNQYQLIRLHPERIKRWARRYDPNLRRWVGDTSASERGDDWRIEHPVAFARVAGTFGGESPDGRAEADKRKTSEIELAHGFVDRVLEVCELRHGGEGTRIDAIVDTRYPYLRVNARRGNIAQSFPVGLVEGNVSRAVVDDYVREVFGPYRALDPSLRCTIVYGGERAADALLRYAAASNVELCSFVELQGIIDFRGYVERQTLRLTSDVGYPPSLYVPQQMEYEVGTRRHTSTDALAELMGWLQEPRARFVLVLGDFGTGKTFLLRELARQMPTQIPHLVPVLIELRSLEKARTLEQLVAQHLATARERFIDLEAFPYMLREGRIALLFDGFDELATRVTYRRAAEHFETLVQAAGGDAKVVVTSRTQHFESDQQVRSALLERAEVLPGLSLCRVKPFDDDQIVAYLERRLGDAAAARERFELLDEIKDLLGLSHNPRMLGFIASIPEDRLREAREHKGAITAAGLYRLLIDQWLASEEEKTQPRGAAPAPSSDHIWDAVTSLALALWTKIDRTIHTSELADHVSATFEHLSVEPREGTTMDAAAFAHLVGSRTLLVRDEEGALSFVHGSVMEWFVAHHVAAQVAAGDGLDTLASREMTALMLDFVCDLADDEGLAVWAAQAIASGDRSPARANALMVLDRLGREVDATALAGGSLSGHDLSGRYFARASFVEADLTETRLMEADLTAADLTGASLTRADLTRARLVGARLHDVDATGARLLGSDLSNAQLDGARLRRAKLVGALVDDGALAHADTFGAALPGMTAPAPTVAPAQAAGVQALAVHPSGEVIATGHTDATVRLWDVESGTGLRTLIGHRDWVRGVVFSPDGSLLASASDDKTVRVWDVESGRLVHTLNGHEDWVRALAFSADGALLASGADDRSLRVWDPLRGTPVAVLEDAARWNHLLAFRGDTLMSLEPSGSLRTWSPQSGEGERTLDALTETWTQWLSPDGALAAGRTYNDASVVVFDIDRDRALQRLDFSDGHKRVLACAFSPDGTLLAVAHQDRTLSVWDWRAGVELRSALSSESGAVAHLAFLPGGQTLVGAGDSAMNVWSLASGTVRPMRSSARPPVRAVGFSPAEGGLVLAFDAGMSHWDLATGRLLEWFDTSETAESVAAVAPDGRTFARGARDLEVVEVGTGITLWTLSDVFVEALAFSPDGSRLAIVGQHGVQIADMNDRTLDWTVSSEGAGEVEALAFSPDEELLACATDEEPWLLNLHAGGERRPLKDAASILGFAFAPDGLLAGGGQDGCVYVWSRAGDEPQVLRGHDDWVRAVAFSPDGKLLASGSDDLTIRLWDPSDGRCLHVLQEDVGWLQLLAFSPDGSVLASVSDDQAVKLWDVASGTLRATIVDFAEGAVTFTPDGRYRVEGRIGGAFWYALGLCRFAPGELDEFLPPGTLRPLGDDEEL